MKPQFILRIILALAFTLPVTHWLTSQCPISTAPSSNPPNSIVRVQVLSVKPNSDMEGDDDYVPFYDNHADIYGKITIDGHEFNLPEKEDDDTPFWDDIFEQHVTTTPVKIVISIKENDSGLTGDNDDVDINPDPNKNELEIEFDLCALTVKINNEVLGTQSPIERKAGNDSEDATIIFSVGTADGRPVTTNDLALVNADLVQVLFRTPKLVTSKPTIVMASIANNYTSDINTNVRVVVSGAGVNRNDIFPLNIKAGQVKKEYYYLDDPIRFPQGSAPGHVAVMIRVDDTGNQNLDPQHCLRMNDGNPNRLIWKTVNTPVRYELLWAKVGTLLDGGNFASDAQLQNNMDLGGAYIHGVFPLSFPYQHKSTVDILPPIDAAVDFLTTILSVFGIPADNVIPYALVLELNGVANIVGCDRIMGVLPNNDWFERFSYDFLDEVTGLSLGEFAPRAVIFLPQYGDTTFLGPAMTLPAHELGHTFGLSTDPTLKDSWVCNVNWPILGSSACGIVGGFDEYKSSTFPTGNPSNGFWIKQGGEPTALDSLVNKEMCGTFCLMFGSPSNAHLNWGGTNRKWIDPPDYDQLVNKLQMHPDPEIIYISGMISWNDQFYLGSVQHIGEGIPDRDTSYGAYAIRFLNAGGQTLKEVGLPVHWNASDITEQPRPVTFFGLNFEFPGGTKTIHVINRMSSKVLGTIHVSSSKPGVRLKIRTPLSFRQNGKVPLIWSANDRDGDKLKYFIMAREAREEGWFPVAYWQNEKQYTLSLSDFEPGHYVLKVMASDGVHVSSSNEMGIEVTK